MLRALALAALLAAPVAAAAGQGGHAARLRTARLESGVGSSMRELYPFYHSSEDIHNRLTELSTKCPGMSLQSIEKSSIEGDTKQVEVVTIRAPGSEPINRNFYLFGEHARELVSPESGLHLVEALCGENDLKDQAAAVLKNSEFQLVVNANRASREKVEEGDFCLRANPNGVDLNRNWDEEWTADSVYGTRAETNPGPSPFSEAETRIFKDLVEEYKPTNFLTIHSGTKGMYMPWAYDMEHLAQRNEPQMMQILKTLDENHCQCPFGAAGKEVGYSCPGTCLDWVYDKLKTPYSFAFEIYTSPAEDDDLKSRWEELMSQAPTSLLQQNSSLAHPHFQSIFSEHPSSFVQLRSRSGRRSGQAMSPSECFSQFNPETKESLDQVVENWSKAYLDLADLVATNLQQTTGAEGAAAEATRDLLR